ncbi:MAG: hypothetical protein FD180_77 [Planctomycetota bacterium]|nr:MAG: hypothetical protein FD180_77 [Planctomycetota bacterium]
MRPLIALIICASLSRAEDPAPLKSDPAAEQLLQSVEAKLQNAKTVSIRASLAVRLGQYPVNRAVEIDFKEGNRARLLLTGGNAVEGAACDGKELRVKLAGGGSTAAAAADFAEKAREKLLRVPMNDLWGYFQASPKAASGYSEFAFLPDEKIGDRAVRVVTFVATRETTRSVYRMWIDETSLEVLKREMVEKFGDVETREVLTFASTKWDADLPDSTFDSVEGKAAPAKSDPAAEDLVKKVEAKIASAKTVSIRLTMEVAAGDEKQAFEVAIDVKEGNRARLAVDGKGPDGKSAYSLRSVCDGKTVRRTDPDGYEDEEAEAGLAAKVLELAVRAPLKELSKMMGGSASKSPMEYSGFAFAPDEKLGERTARVVTYAASRGSVRLAMKLWIDAEKLALLKRETVETKKGVESARVTDTFSAMTCDGEIADDVFALPEVKEGEKKEEK